MSELTPLALRALEAADPDPAAIAGLPAPARLADRLHAGGAPAEVGRGVALTENARTVLERRYLLRDGRGEVAEREAELFRRVAAAVAAPDAAYGEDPAAAEERFYGRMARLEFMPNSPTLMNAGRALGQLAACFVLPVGDSMPEIFEAVKWASMVQMTGGGTGFAFSRLRPAGDRVSTTKGVASGPLPFMDVFNAATDAVKQGGTRRGANMGVLRVDHPDILEFITAKLDPRRLRNFNLSVAVTDAFMDAVARGGELPLKNPRTGEIVRTVDARRVFDLMASAAWRTGDPGVIFIDRINAAHPTPELGNIESTNPCVTGDTRVWVEDVGWAPIRELVGQTPRIATAAGGRLEFRAATRVNRTGVRPVFRLRTVEGLELRLTADHRVATERGDVAAAELRAGDRIPAVPGKYLRDGSSDRALATVLDLVAAGVEEVFDLTEPATSHFFANGLLVHNCGEQPLLPFESCVLGSINVAKFVTGARLDWDRLREAVRDGVHFLDNVIDAGRYPLAEIEGITRQNRKIGLGIMGFADALILLGVPYDTERAFALADELGAFLERESLAASAELAGRRGAFPSFPRSRWAERGHPPLRNATTTTVAPTGTISIIAGCSSGIEPLFAVSYVRRVMEGTRLVEVHPIFRRIAAERGIWSDALERTLAERGRVRGLDEVPPDVQALFPTAHDLPPDVHVRMQAVFQRYAHAAVSKTVNFPQEASAADVAAVYQLAFDLGCKGVTVYRDRSREEQVLSFGDDAHALEPPAERCPECGGELLGERGCAACRKCGWSRCS